MDERMDAAHLTGKRRGAREGQEAPKGKSSGILPSQLSTPLKCFFFLSGVEGGCVGGRAVGYGRNKLPTGLF